jgi:MFS family permease
MNNTKKLQLISLFNGMTFYTPIFTLFLLQRSLGLGFIVAAQTVYTVGMMVSTVPTGILADKWGQKRTIQIGLLLVVITMLQLLFLHSAFMLVVFFFFRGVGGGFIDGADESLLFESYREEHKKSEGYSRAFGKMLSNDTLGFVVATAAAGLLVQAMGKSSYMPLIAFTAAVSFIAFLVASTLKPVSKSIQSHESIKFFKQMKEGIKVVKHSRTIFALLVLGLLTLNGEYFLRQTYQPYFQTLAVPALFLGLALSAGKTLNFIAMRNVHRLEEFFTVDTILFWINVVIGAAFVLMAFANSAFLLVAVFMIIQASMNTQQPIISDYINQNIESDTRTTILSTVSFIQSIGQVIVRILLGISVGVVGLSHSYGLQGVYMIVGVIIGVWYIRRCGCLHKIRRIEEVTSK